jgi:hypothetical protein
MSESQALGYFFTISNGLFTATTVTTNAGAWPQVHCTACHDVPADHPDSMPALALFNSQTAQRIPIANVSALCGQCHGTLHFPDTDHRIYDAWLNSRHANTQNDVANELSQSRANQTPDQVIHGADAENCIGCQAPTAILSNGGMNESQALGYFFTTTKGVITGTTVPNHGSDWPSIACNACHDPHDPGKFSFLNSTTATYQVMTNADQLCGQCHGNLRFPGTDHLTYNLMTGTGGIGVTNQQMMPKVSCTDCHMYYSGVDGSNSTMYHGHSWTVKVTEPGGPATSSCTQCHATIDAAAADAIIAGWQADFQALDQKVQLNVARVATAMGGVQNPALQAALAEAQQNLAYAESDEGGGVHNHTFLMALLNDANQKALSIPLLSATVQGTNVVISWTGAGTLQSADSPLGFWKDVSGATNPKVIPPATHTQGQFYRLRP